MEKFFLIICYYSFWFMSCEELWTRGPRYHVTTSYLLDWKPIEERNPGRDFDKPNASINLTKMGFTILLIFDRIQRTQWKKYPTDTQI